MSGYHYTECGLDNVWLMNGVAFETDPNYGEVYAIEDVEGLHRQIASDLIHLPRPLNGAEFRFLRRELDLSQKALAILIGSNDQSIAKFEKARDKPVSNGLADRLLRLLYADGIDKPKVRELLQVLTDLDEQHAALELRLRRTDKKWRNAA
jgi:putative transcriptional regulator